MEGSAGSNQTQVLLDSLATIYLASLVSLARAVCVHSQRLSPRLGKAFAPQLQ